MLCLKIVITEWIHKKDQMTSEINKENYKKTSDGHCFGLGFGEQDCCSCAARDAAIRTHGLMCLLSTYHVSALSGFYFLCFQEFYNGRY